MADKNVVQSAAEELAQALAGVDGVRVYEDLSAAIDPPAVVIGPPRLEWLTPGRPPTTATFIVYVVTAMDENALPNLWDLVPKVVEALEELVDVDTLRADPGVYPTGGTGLPAYEITVEIAL